jgi:hypothetical protein
MGEEFAASRFGRQRLDEERDSRLQDLVDFEESFLDIEEARETLKIALGILGRRKIIRLKGDAILLDPSRKSLLEYYAGSISHYFDPAVTADDLEVSI